MAACPRRERRACGGERSHPVDPGLQCPAFCSIFVLMDREATRRTVSLGCLAATTAVATWMRPAKPQPRITRYKDGLAARFKRGNAGLTTMALAHIGGFSD